MYDIERCSWFSGSRITAQNANYNTHPNVIPLQYFVIMFMQFYLLFLYPMKDFQLYTKGFEHWHILWQMVVKPFDMCVTLKYMYIYIYIYELSVCVSMMMYCVVVCSCWYWVSTLILCIIIILTPHPLKKSLI